MTEKDYPKVGRPAANDGGGPLDMPGGNNGRPGEDKDGPYGAIEDATDLGVGAGKSPMEDAGTPGGTAGTGDVARVQDHGRSAND